MAMSVQGPGEEQGVMANINTTPLVDVMLVLLIIFLITDPVINKTVTVKLPKAEQHSDADQAGEHHGRGGQERATSTGMTSSVPNDNQLLTMIEQQAVKVPQPEIHIRGDQQAAYKAIGHVLYELQRGGIVKVAFLTEPDLSHGAPTH